MLTGRSVPSDWTFSGGSSASAEVWGVGAATSPKRPGGQAGAGAAGAGVAGTGTSVIEVRAWSGRIDPNRFLDPTPEARPPPVLGVFRAVRCFEPTTQSTGGLTLDLPSSRCNGCSASSAASGDGCRSTSRPTPSLSTGTASSTPSGIPRKSPLESLDLTSMHAIPVVPDAPVLQEGTEQELTDGNPQPPTPSERNATLTPHPTPLAVVPRARSRRKAPRRTWPRRRPRGRPTRPS